MTFDETLFDAHQPDDAQLRSRGFNQKQWVSDRVAQSIAGADKARTDLPASTGVFQLHWLDVKAMDKLYIDDMGVAQ